VVEAAKKYVQAVFTGSEESGLYFCGKAGTGKTFLAAAIANYHIASYLIMNSRYRECLFKSYAEGYPHPSPAVISPVRFFNTADLLEPIRASYNVNNSVTFENMLDVDIPEDWVKECQKVHLLILDDFGSEKPTAWAQEKLFSIIEHRYVHRRPLIITSNLFPQEIEQTYDERIADRIRAMCRVIILPGDSLRPTA